MDEPRGNSKPVFLPNLSTTSTQPTHLPFIHWIRSMPLKPFLHSYAIREHSRTKAETLPPKNPCLLRLNKVTAATVAMERCHRLGWEKELLIFEQRKEGGLPCGLTDQILPRAASTKQRYCSQLSAPGFLAVLSKLREVVPSHLVRACVKGGFDSAAHWSDQPDSAGFI